MSAPGSPPPARQDRRKERTRAALIAAAQHLLAEGADAHASIQAITELADVGFGSFYNYFSSKEELFEAAASAAVDDYLRWLAERLPDGVDPVTRLIENVRQTGRLALEQPRIAAILTRRLALLDDGDDPRGRSIRADVRAAMTAGGAVPETLEFDILATVALGAIMAVLRRTISLSPAETAEAADVLAHAVLRLLSLPSAGSAR
ncbi:TetR/AcrR family transcriptional regulator [Actinoplanes derwentensis]|uniref:DNA-binding transcriptional regulator, AcrR family n=1 Tax=Actinoplanes derwentensis TaxID=113562 RepID=A0A1H1W3V9_9ACTN|nr:TetR/AcrR family transcriptional regulator [Actinoplanes derwentensis]GID84048.1 TetR family transcriptional regulator [Actinoplanes derwentensis]SDS91978.1 DNA-binding transcriptional regulator, AcrR family [Actinoplanes derwentensis]